MIESQRGDILKSDSEALVNTVNCVGVMGRGIALQFRKEYPENFKQYEKACERGEVQPGEMLVHDRETLAHPRYIINFPTKRHWKGKSRIEDIRSGLKALIEEVRAREIMSIAVPPLGCGLGGLNWCDVRPLIVDAFEAVPHVTVALYEPAGAPSAEEIVKSHRVPNMTAGRAALLGLVRRYQNAVMAPYVTLIEIHKLMYFMQMAGEPLKLQFSKGHYGPYAENLRHVLQAIDGHFIKGYGDSNDEPEKQIEIVPAPANAGEQFLQEHSDTHHHFERVGELIAGFETPYGIELLATVHWVATHENASTARSAVNKVHSWNERKRMFTEEHIKLAWDTLNKGGWMPSLFTLGRVNAISDTGE